MKVSIDRQKYLRDEYSTTSSKEGWIIHDLLNGLDALECELRNLKEREGNEYAIVCQYKAERDAAVTKQNELRSAIDGYLQAWSDETAAKTTLEKRREILIEAADS